MTWMWEYIYTNIGGGCERGLHIFWCVVPMMTCKAPHHLLGGTSREVCPYDQNQGKGIIAWDVVHINCAR